MRNLITIFSELPNSDSGLKLPKNLPTGTPDMATIFNTVIAITAAIAVLVIVVAGLKYVTSSGDPQGVASARKAIIYAAVGLIVCGAAYSIVGFTLRGV